MDTINFYKNRVCLNCLCNSEENGQEILEAMDGYVILGLLSNQYTTIDSAIEDMRKYQKLLNNNISVGLGSGDPNQWKMVVDISRAIVPKHINQIFPLGGYTRCAVGEHPFINSMVSPCGQNGYVKISTGPLSSKSLPGIVPVKTAIALAKEQGANSLKYFPMDGLSTLEEFKAVAIACAEENFALEPTGGINLENIEMILRIAAGAGVEKIIPHIYSSIVDKKSGATSVDAVKKIYDIMKKIF